MRDISGVWKEILDFLDRTIITIWRKKTNHLTITLPHSDDERRRRGRGAESWKEEEEEKEVKRERGGAHIMGSGVSRRVYREEGGE